jgi:hypothetical protein
MTTWSEGLPERRRTPVTGPNQFFVFGFTDADLPGLQQKVFVGFGSNKYLFQSLDLAVRGREHGVVLEVRHLKLFRAGLMWQCAINFDEFNA